MPTGNFEAMLQRIEVNPSFLLLSSTFLLFFAANFVRWMNQYKGIEPQVKFRSYLAYLVSFKSVFVIFFIVSSTEITRHALLATSTRLPASALNTLPNLTWLYLIFHFSLILGVIFNDRLPPNFHFSFVWSALFLYSSYLYFPTLFALELGSSYSYLYLFVLLLFAGWIHRSSSFTSKYSPWSVLVPLLTFLLLTGVSSVFSLNPADSMNHYIQIACFALLPLLLAQYLTNERQWRIAALGGIFLGGMIWALLSFLKFGLLIRDLGWLPALRYRLFIADVGPNWVAHSVVALFPLSIAFWFVMAGRWRKLLWSIITLILFFSIAYTQSNWGYSGWIAISLGISSFILIKEQPGIAAWWRRHIKLHIPVLLTSLGLLGAIFFSAGWVASQINSYSFYSRLYLWRTLLYQMSDHLWFGTGLGIRYVTARFGNLVSWGDVGTPSNYWVIQQPLSLYLQKEQLGFHAHNLWIELAVGAGLPALMAFFWFLWGFGKCSLSALQRATGESRLLIAGCIAGIIAVLGWGLVDVMEFSPPFFTTPVWLLIGLLLAAPHAFNLPIANGKTPIKGLQLGALHSNLKVGLLGLCLMFAIIAIILPVLGNFHYQVAYAAFQEHRWAIVATELSQASLWEPLNAKYYQLRGEAFINLERFRDAIAMYERAAQLKRDFAPYHSQLGWLYWLKGDLAQATVQFQKAVDLDPLEAWRGGLHTDLALAHVAQGRIAEAIPLFKKAIELDPEMKLASVPVWVPAQGLDEKFDVVLDPIYFASANGESASGPLKERILAHLGRADYTSRQFTFDHDALASSTTISFNQILDAIKVDYLAAKANNSLEAPLLLATVSEAARVLELNTRAEQAYLLYQSSFPASEYGFRELGTFYREQGRLAEAQATLERAVQIRPNDPDSWSALAEVYINRELQSAAMTALDTLNDLSPLYPRLNELLAQLHQQRGDLAEATANLSRLLVITESIPNRLTLARLYRQLEEQKQADEQCLQAADVLQRTMPRPLNPQLWDVSVCLAQSNLQIEDLMNQNICISPNGSICRVLLGHVHLARGEFEQALTAYQEASEIRPDDGGSHYFLGQTYVALGQLQQAEAEFIQSAELNRKESLPLLALGRLQWDQGRREAAIASFNAAVLATPGWGEAHTTLGNALKFSGDDTGAAVNYQLAQIADGDLHEGEFYDFTAHLADAQIQAPGPAFVKNDYFTLNTQDDNIEDDRQRVLFMHPNSSASYSITVPSKALIAFNIATSPDSWTMEGDGVTFSIKIVSNNIPLQIFSKYIDPKNNVADRRWHQDMIDLSAYSEKPITVIFETNAGPAGDDRFDWAGWGNPRIIAPLNP
jgi:tetratricopeptide (TPR) repeat protein